MPVSSNANGVREGGPFMGLVRGEGAQPRKRLCASTLLHCGHQSGRARLQIAPGALMRLGARNRGDPLNEVDTIAGGWPACPTVWKRYFRTVPMHKNRGNRWWML